MQAKTDPVAMAKRSAALAAVEDVEQGMIVGLGTGSTAAYAIDALAQRCRAGLRIETVATSIATQRAAIVAGLPVLDFSAVGAIDLCIDGVDEIDLHFRAIKGAGGAMLREKIIASAATRMIAIADGSKAVTALGQMPVPVEILGFALRFVSDRVERLGGRPILRVGADGVAVLSDQGNMILDCHFGMIEDPQSLADALSSVPGLLGHGLFLSEIDALYMATGTSVEKRLR